MTSDELDLRDSLTLRKLRGEVLSEDEERLLGNLNELCERELPKPASLPPEIAELVEKVLERFRRRL